MSSFPMFGPSNARQTPRLKLPAAYTLVRVRPQGAERFELTGYIYDISSTGMRFELDESLAPGTQVQVKAMLPGAAHTTFTASGRVIRLHDDDGLPGPVRMGMTFDSFETEIDALRLNRYLSAASRQAA